jgi:hypothetical protein
MSILSRPLQRPFAPSREVEYADGMVGRWVWYGSTNPRTPRTSCVRLDLSDDAKTYYQWWPGPDHDVATRKDGFAHWLSATFTPAVPEEATDHLASWEGKTYEIPLTS